MTLSPKLGVVEISTLWHFRLPLPIQMFIKVVSSPRLSGIGMPTPIRWSHPLKMQRIVLLSSLLWWELGTNSLITGPGEWLSFRCFTSKLSWSWSCRNCYAPAQIKAGMKSATIHWTKISCIEHIRIRLGLYPFNADMSRLMTKPTKWHVLPAKTQISLGIHPVW